MIIIALILSLAGNGFFLYRWILAHKAAANALAAQVEAEAKAVTSVIEGKK
jgi:hypothetical protein